MDANTTVYTVFSLGENDFTYAHFYGVCTSLENVFKILCKSEKREQYILVDYDDINVDNDENCIPWMVRATELNSTSDEHLDPEFYITTIKPNDLNNIYIAKNDKNYIPWISEKSLVNFVEDEEDEEDE